MSDTAVSQLFTCRKPLLGRSEASVLVDDEGLAIVHPLLDGQLAIPRDQLAAVVADPQDMDDQVVLRREVRRVHLKTTQLAPPNVLVAFRPPLHLPPLRSGARKALAISGQENRHGLDVDALGFTVDDPAGLAAAVAGLGVRAELTTTAAFVALAGQAFGPEADRIRNRGRRRTRTRLLKALALAPLFTVALAGRISVDGGFDLHRLAAVASAALAWFAVIAVVVAAGFAHKVGPARHPRITSVRQVVAWAATPTAMVVIPLLLRGWIHTHLGVPTLAITGLAAALPGGVWAGWLLHRLRRG